MLRLKEGAGLQPLPVSSLGKMGWGSYLGIPSPNFSPQGFQVGGGGVGLRIAQPICLGIHPKVSSL